MNLQIRVFENRDLAEVVRLSLLAWEPIFMSFKQILGPEIYHFLYPDWRESQRQEVEATCRDTEKVSVLVAELSEQTVGFLAYEIRGQTGEVLYLAVHPEYQNLGIGTELNIAAVEKMKVAKVVIVEVGTGGDEAHAPARRSYEKAGYTAFPQVRYFKYLL